MAKLPEDGIQFGPIKLGEYNVAPRALKIINRIIDNCDLANRGHTIDGEISCCWEWLGADSGPGTEAGRGYGRIKIDGIVSATHRVMYACFYGYLPPKRHIDHHCENRICCNPAHLESVTAKQNNRRKFKR